MSHAVLVLLGIAWIAWVIWRWQQKPEHRMSLVVLTAFFGTNLVLTDRGLPLRERVIPSIAASCVAAVLFTGWRLWRDARAKP